MPPLLIFLNFAIANKLLRGTAAEQTIKTKRHIHFSHSKYLQYKKYILKDNNVGELIFSFYASFLDIVFRLIWLVIFHLFCSQQILVGGDRGRRVGIVFIFFELKTYVPTLCVIDYFRFYNSVYTLIIKYLMK